MSNKSKYNYIKWELGTEHQKNNLELVIMFMLSISYYKIILEKPYKVDECIEQFENDIDIIQWEGDKEIIAKLENLHISIINEIISVIKEYGVWKDIRVRLDNNFYSDQPLILQPILKKYEKIESELKGIYKNGILDFIKQYEDACKYMALPIPLTTQSKKWREITGWEELDDNEMQTCIKIIKNRITIIDDFNETYSFIKDHINDIPGKENKNIDGIKPISENNYSELHKLLKWKNALFLLGTHIALLMENKFISNENLQDILSRKKLLNIIHLENQNDKMDFAKSLVT